MKKWFQNQKTETILFLVSFFFLVMLGLALSYNYPLKDNYNLLFDADTARVIKDAIEINTDHYRATVHPLFVLFVQPVVSVIAGFVFNKYLAIILLSAIVSSLSVFYIYKILDTISNNKKLNMIISLIYLFSFSNIIFTSGIETYNFASLFLIMMWYYFLKQENKPVNGYSYIMLVLFGVLTIAFTITNVCIYLIMIFLLWVSKKINIKQVCLIGFVTILMVLGLNVTQKLAFQTTPMLWNISRQEEKRYLNVETDKKESIKRVIVNDYYNSLISSDIQMKISYGSIYNNDNYRLNFKDMNLLNFILVSGFYILLLFLVVRNYKKKRLLNYGLIGSLGFNTVLHLVYGNATTYIYSLHFLYIIILLFGINLLLETNKKLKSFSGIYVCIFLLVELVTNSVMFTKTINYVKGVVQSNFLVSYFGPLKSLGIECLIILLAIAITLLVIFACKKMIETPKKETKKLYLVGMFLLFLLFESMFVGLENVENHYRFLWIKLPEARLEFVPKEKKDYVSKEFKTYFKKELQDLKEYQEEANLFKSEYETKKVTDTNWTDYYYFGFGNRRKLIYKPGYLMDIETKKEIMHFEEENYLIIPNTYTVLIETKDHNFIKIMEDERVFIILLMEKIK